MGWEPIDPKLIRHKCRGKVKSTPEFQAIMYTLTKRQLKKGCAVTLRELPGDLGQHPAHNFSNALRKEVEALGLPYRVGYYGKSEVWVEGI